MASKLSDLFGHAYQYTPPSVYATTPVRNEAGAPAFVRSDEERLLQVLTTGTFENTFYADGKDLADQAIALMQEYVKSDPKYLAQAIVYARTEGLMRLVPITGLVVLSTAEDKSYFRAIFDKVIQTPGDLQDFLTIVRSKRIRGMGKVITHAVQNWLANISEYHVIKYGSEHQKMSLRDMYRLARPKLTGKAEAIAKYVVKGELPPTISGSRAADALNMSSHDVLQLAGYEVFKETARIYQESGDARYAVQMLQLVKDHRLPWEVVTTHIKSKEGWATMMRQMPYMALLRNLNNLIKSGVLDDYLEREYVMKTLTDPARIASSKQFPFRFYSAMKAIVEPTVGKLWRADIGNALNFALEQSVANMPELGDYVLIANDISGSMHDPISPKSDTTMAEIAGIFAAAAYRKARHGQIVSFDTEAHPRAVAPEAHIASIAEQISGHGGGTSLSAPILYAFKQSTAPFSGGQGWIHHVQAYDTAIFITDSESWYDHLHSHSGVMDTIRRYRQSVNPNLKCFFLQLAPYQTAQVRQDEEGIYYLYGWSGNVLPFIASMVHGGKSQVEHVRAMEIGATHA